MRSTIILAVLADVCVAVQTNLTGAAQLILGPPVMVAVSGPTTGATAPVVGPEIASRAVG